MKTLSLKTLLLCSALAITQAACSPADNPKAPMTDTAPSLESHLYLEEVLGDEALETVKAWNARSLDRLQSDPMFKTLETEALEILNSKDKIPYVSYRAGKVHNFWQDAEHVRGVWRSSTLDSYLTETPKWETVLDFDKLAADESKNWVYKGNNCLGPDYVRCMVNLSDGGKDAVVRREFNTKTKTFVKGGFETEESKGSMDWLDKDTMVIGVDFGEGTMTDSGYPMIAKLWMRGTPLSEAKEIMRGDKTDVGFWPGTLEMPDGSREIFLTQSITFYDSAYYWVPVDEQGNTLQSVQLPLPTKSDIFGTFKDQMLVRINEDWRGSKAGDILSFSLPDFMKTGQIGSLHSVYAPDARSSVENMGVTKSKILMSIYTDVSGRAYSFDWDGNAWASQPLDFPTGTVSVGATNDKEDVAFISTENFLTPDTLWTYNTASGERAKAKALPDWFDASAMVAEQHFATSTDGTKVPYFVVHKKDMTPDGTSPALLYGYGGFEISLNPSYSAVRGKLWIERGGVYILANIRGGGEYGPKWHQAGLKTERQKIYDDFIAVAEDVIDRKITSPDHLGIEGGSNGGLLMGVMTTQRPDLFSAVICAVPLLDMMRYHTLLAGASWMGEYGDPADPVEGAFLQSISPYHNVKPGVDYPEVFFVTSTKDDRVHPGHARKMAARMEDLGHEFLYYENIDGGHSASANLKESAKRLALQHTYLWQKLK